MIDFLVKEYHPLNKKEEELIRNNNNDSEVLSELLILLEKRDKRYKLARRVNNDIIKVVPVAALTLFLVMPSYYEIVFLSAILLIIINELTFSIGFRAKYYEKLEKNILIIKSLLHCSMNQYT